MRRESYIVLERHHICWRSSVSGCVHSLFEKIPFSEFSGLLWSKKMLSRVTMQHTKELVTKLASKVSINVANQHQFVKISCINHTRRVFQSSICCGTLPLMIQKRTVFSMVSKPKTDKKLGHIGFNLPCFMIVARGTKTKKAAAKRFIVKGNGDLKYGRAGKRHNTSKKTKAVKRRLNQKVRVL